MAQKKFYAVKRGRQTGIFTSWDECYAQVGGFAGAVHKSFASLQEAKLWLFGSNEMEPLFADEPMPTEKRTPSKTNSMHEDDSPSTADYIVYTDGSCLKNPDGPGGYAAVILDSRGTLVREISGGEPSTTNNRMELRAGIEALNALPARTVVDFHTDSQYLKNAFVNHWLPNWKRRGWLTTAGEPVKNQDLWRSLDAAFHNHTVRFHWVKSHAGNRWNEHCDTLARQEALKFTGEQK